MNSRKVLRNIVEGACLTVEDAQALRDLDQLLADMVKELWMVNQHYGFDEDSLLGRAKLLGYEGSR